MNELFQKLKSFRPGVHIVKSDKIGKGILNLLVCLSIILYTLRKLRKHAELQIIA